MRLFNLYAIFSNTICVEENHEEVNQQPEQRGEKDDFECVPSRAEHIHFDHQVRVVVLSQFLGVVDTVFIPSFSSLPDILFSSYPPCLCSSQFKTSYLESTIAKLRRQPPWLPATDCPYGAAVRAELCKEAAAVRLVVSTLVGNGQNLA